MFLVMECYRKIKKNNKMGHGRVTAKHMSCMTQHAIDHAKDDIIAHGGVSVTRVTWVMVITWTGMTPRSSYDRYRETVSIRAKKLHIVTRW